MADVTQAQAQAVLQHLSAEYDAAIAYANAQADEFANLLNRSELRSVASALAADKVNNLRELTAAAERHPDRFAGLAAADENDLREASGYQQQATVAQVLHDTGTATVEEAAADVGEVAKGAVNASGFVLGAVLKNLPWQLYAVAGVAALGIGWFYLRPFLPGRK